MSSEAAATKALPRLNHSPIPAPARSTKYAPASFRPASEGGSAGPSQSENAAKAMIASGTSRGRRPIGVLIMSGLAQDAVQLGQQQRNHAAGGVVQAPVVDLAVVM